MYASTCRGYLRSIFLLFTCVSSPKIGSDSRPAEGLGVRISGLGHRLRLYEVYAHKVGPTPEPQSLHPKTQKRTPRNPIAF